MFPMKPSDLRKEIEKVAADAVNELTNKHRTPKLTPMEYAAQQGLVCPYCGDSTAIILGTDDLDENGYTIGNACMVCDAEWVETYELTGYKEV